MSQAISRITFEHLTQLANGLGGFATIEKQGRVAYPLASIKSGSRSTAFFRYCSASLSS